MPTWQHLKEEQKEKPNWLRAYFRQEHNTIIQLMCYKGFCYVCHKREDISISESLCHFSYHSLYYQPTHICMNDQKWRLRMIAIISQASMQLIFGEKTNKSEQQKRNQNEMRRWRRKYKRILELTTIHFLKITMSRFIELTTEISMTICVIVVQ